MCGIVGLVGRPQSHYPRVMSDMLQAIAHRGPDDSGSHAIGTTDSIVCLGNARLSILDLSRAGHQPMHDPETGNWIVYNGEVYNFQQLRNQLKSLGCIFSSETDTEVVLKAYGVWGPSSVNRLRGMFAFALWDAKKGELFLCRDRAGEKPLYYFSSPSAPFVFASEVRALLASGIPERRLDSVGLEIFLSNGFLVSPRTLIANIRSLLPGHWMRISPSGQILDVVRYWSPPLFDGLTERNPDVGQIRERLREAVKLRLVSDVPLGAFLSGGIDSSTVVALMQEAGSETRTFSVVFEEPEFDESVYSRWVAKQFCTKHTEVTLTQADFIQMVPSALSAMDQPTFDAINTYCVSRVARQAGLKVALSGTGSDELFGGYDFFNWVPMIASTKKAIDLLPAAAFNFVRNMLLRNAISGISGIAKILEMAYSRNGTREEFLVAAYQTTQTQFPSWSRRALLRKSAGDGDGVRFGLPLDFLRLILPELTGESSRNAVSKLALRTFLGERCLRDIDFMSMSVSLEVRSPFLDHLLVEDSFRYIASVRTAGAPDKPFLKNVVGPILGKEYPWRRKQGFTFPFQAWLRQVFDWQETKDIIHSGSLIKDLGLEPNSVSLFFADFKKEKSIPWTRVWALFVLLSWCQRHRVKQ